MSAKQLDKRTYNLEKSKLDICALGRVPESNFEAMRLESLREYKPG